ncbi:MAG TPA: ribonucleoside-diphosphate reductase subunit alpha [Candidatus Paceibacterota bacterium]|nr:ribonucleoside-diphosphate reductase subunit alpha [Candidatus Paceibacterota bacterium]
MLEIKKRNGTIVSFDPAKIPAAMEKAFIASSWPYSPELLERMTKEIVRRLDERFTEQIPTVENVQDFVELELMGNGFLEVAKHYIVYRYEHAKIRQEEKQEFLEKAQIEGFSITTKSGKKERFDEAKVRETLAHHARGFESVIDLNAALEELKFNLYEGITTEEVARAMILVVRAGIERDPAYSKVAARMLRAKLYRDVFGENYDPKKLKEEHARVFARNIKDAVERELLDARMLDFDLPALAAAFALENDDLFEYMGLEILISRYMLEDPATHKPLETPQMFWMRIAMGLSLNEPAATRDRVAREFYDVLSNFYYTPGGRTLFQAGAKKAQLSNCFLNTVPDSLDGIFKAISDNAQYLKWSGGTGTDWTPLRATGAMIKGTGVPSQGIVPFLKIANDVNLAINRSGKRRGAGCVYLETWHMDIEDFLELRKNTGDERRRTHDINTANWIPDLFMKRVREGGAWTLFSPDEVPDLHEIYGAAFEKKYLEYEKMADEGKISLYKRVSAADLWKKMLAMLFETGHPWITWKDPSNVRSPQDHAGVIHNSNLCTEITLNTGPGETAVCTIGSLNFAKFVVEEGGGVRFDAELVGRVTKVAMRMLDNVIDLNYYPTEDAKRGNLRHRPVGLGIRGYHDALYRLGIHFDSKEALDFADESMEIVAYNAILASSELAKEKGTYETYKGSKWERGIFPQDTIKLLEAERGEEVAVPAEGKLDWAPVRAHVKQYGMRNSNTMAIAPTASTANLVGCIPCVEPIYKNIYVKSNKEGEYVVLNKYLVEDLKKLGLWDAGMLNKLKYYDGSVQEIGNIPQELKRKYKEVFEIDGRWLIEAAARRGRWMDQSQSLNIFYSGTSGRELSELYFLAWERGLKTTYYLRTLGASQVEKASVSTSEFGATHQRERGGVIEEAVTVSEVVAEAVPAMAAAPAAAAAGKFDDAYLARVAAGEEVGICESCEA